MIVIEVYSKLVADINNKQIFCLFNIASITKASMEQFSSSCSRAGVTVSE